MSDRDFSAFLAANGFAARPDLSPPPTAMGNQVELFSDGSRFLRRVTDRGRRYVDLSRTGADDDWRDVFSFAEQIEPGFSAKTGSFEEAVRVLVRLWPAIRLVVSASASGL